MEANRVISSFAVILIAVGTAPYVGALAPMAGLEDGRLKSGYSQAIIVSPMARLTDEAEKVLEEAEGVLSGSKIDKERADGFLRKLNKTVVKLSNALHSDQISAPNEKEMLKKYRRLLLEVIISIKIAKGEKIWSVQTSEVVAIVLPSSETGNEALSEEPLREEGRNILDEQYKYGLLAWGMNPRHGPIAIELAVELLQDPRKYMRPEGLFIIERLLEENQALVPFTRDLLARQIHDTTNDEETEVQDLLRLALARVHPLTSPRQQVEASL